ncbi:hypothetical protein ACHAWU_004385 [Discostella pseudostelligera]|uniref:SCP domain-containing protein n=1 Tax=Discostella pseudostelligera TaxID=259834 RepID=A0ABD3N719_9STRA
MNINSSEMSNEHLEEGGIFHLPTLSEKSAEAESAVAAMSKKKKRNFTIILTVIAVMAIALGLSLSSRDSPKAQFWYSQESPKSSTSTIVTSSLNNTSDQNATPMSDRDNEWLTAHNKRRQVYHEAHGKEYVPLTWSSRLAVHAKERATNLTDHLCNDQPVHHRGVGVVGENLAWNFGDDELSSTRYVDSILTRWVDDAMHWGWPTNSHMTQALWRGTHLLGCGESMNDGGTCRIQVCHYLRPGNCVSREDDAGTNDNWRERMLQTEPCDWPPAPAPTASPSPTYWMGTYSPASVSTPFPTEDRNPKNNMN